MKKSQLLSEKRVWPKLMRLVILTAIFVRLCSDLARNINIYISRNYDHESNSQLIGGLDKTMNETGILYPVCFVTSVYAQDAASADKVRSIHNYRKANPQFGYFAFTNLPKLPCHGWERIVKTHDYKRLITHSRWAKFLGWKHPTLQKCGAVFYADGWLIPTRAPGKIWTRLAKVIRQSDVGLMQERHNKGDGILMEFKRILRLKKDVQSNVRKSLAWFHDQPDFRDNLPLYTNMHFGYDPRNPRFQEATELFWARYSLEIDSWRDQPLWSYILDKLDIVPLPLGNPRFLWDKRWKYYNEKGHTYSIKDQNNAHS